MVIRNPDHVVTRYGWLGDQQLTEIQLLVHGQPGRLIRPPQAGAGVCDVAKPDLREVDVEGAVRQRASEKIAQLAGVMVASSGHLPKQIAAKRQSVIGNRRITARLNEIAPRSQPDVQPVPPGAHLADDGQIARTTCGEGGFHVPMSLGLKIRFKTPRRGNGSRKVRPERGSERRTELIHAAQKVSKDGQPAPFLVFPHVRPRIGKPGLQLTSREQDVHRLGRHPASIRPQHRVSQQIDPAGRVCPRHVKRQHSSGFLAKISN